MIGVFAGAILSMLVATSGLSPVQSEPVYPPGCGPAADVMLVLEHEAGENPIAAMQNVEGDIYYVLSVHPETGVWTMTGFDTTGVACMLLYGDGFTPIED